MNSYLTKSDSEWLNNLADELLNRAISHSVSIGNGAECEVIQISIVLVEEIVKRLRKIAGDLD